MSSPDHCECGQQLRYFGGAGAEGWLCPACDAEHVAELQEITRYQLARAREDIEALEALEALARRED